MKEIINYCRQTKRYGDSEGKCVVLLENNETIQDVIDKYVDVRREWYDQSYSNAKEIGSYTHNNFGEETTIEGRLVIMDTFRMYLD